MPLRLASSDDTDTHGRITRKPLNKVDLSSGYGIWCRGKQGDFFHFSEPPLMVKPPPNTIAVPTRLPKHDALIKT